MEKPNTPNTIKKGKRKPHKTRVSKAEVKEALRKSYGIISKAAQRLGVRRETIYTYLQRWEDLRAVVEEARERIADLAEASLITKIKEGNVSAAIFVLKRFGKDRGYVERAKATRSKDVAV